MGLIRAKKIKKKKQYVLTQVIDHFQSLKCLFQTLFWMTLSYRYKKYHKEFSHRHDGEIKG